MLESATAFFLTYGVQVCLFVIMACLGLSLSVDELVDALMRPKGVLVGLLGQLLLLPGLAFLLVFLVRPDPVVGIGVVLLAACPGGVTSNAYVLLARGDVALSVALTAISSLLIVVTMPVLVYLAFATFGDATRTFDVPVQSLMWSLARLTLLPIGLGMLVRWRFPALASSLQEGARKLAFVMLMAVIIGNTVSSIDVLLANLLQTGLLALALNVAAMAMGFGLARLFALTDRQTVSITFEVGVQNLSLVLTLALAILAIPEYAVFALVYALVMKVTALSLTAWSSRWLGTRAA